MNFSSCRRSGRSRPRRARSSGQKVSRTSSASRSSAKGVNPTRSANRTDTSRRSEIGPEVRSVGAAAAVGRGRSSGRLGVAHSPQNLAAGGFAVPRFGTGGERRRALNAESCVRHRSRCRRSSRSRRPLPGRVGQEGSALGAQDRPECRLRLRPTADGRVRRQRCAMTHHRSYATPGGRRPCGDPAARGPTRAPSPGQVA